MKQPGKFATTRSEIRQCQPDEMPLFEGVPSTRDFESGFCPSADVGTGEGDVSPDLSDLAGSLAEVE